MLGAFDGFNVLCDFLLKILRQVLRGSDSSNLVCLSGKKKKKDVCETHFDFWLKNINDKILF